MSSAHIVHLLRCIVHQVRISNPISYLDADGFTTMCVHSHLLLSYPLPPKFGKACVTRFSCLIVGSQQPEASHRIPKAAVGSGVDACLFDAVEHAMGDLGDSIEDEALLGSDISSRDASLQFVLQRGVLKDEAIR